MTTSQSSKERCKHGVWAADMCYKCRAELVSEPSPVSPPTFCIYCGSLDECSHKNPALWGPIGPPPGPPACPQYFSCCGGDLGGWRMGHKAGCTRSSKSLPAAPQDQESQPTDEVKLLADVMHLWVDGYISKNPNSHADDSISGGVFDKVESLLTAKGIEVDYCGWHHTPTPKPSQESVLPPLDKASELLVYHYGTYTAASVQAFREEAERQMRELLRQVERLTKQLNDYENELDDKTEQIEFYANEVNQLKTAEVERLQGDGWIDVQQAPTDGTEFIGKCGRLVYRVSMRQYYVKWPHEEGGPTFQGQWAAEDDSSIFPVKLDGWMPLPAPPSVSPKERV